MFTEFANWQCFDIRQFVWPMFCPPHWAGYLPFLTKRCLMTMFRRSFNFPTPWPPRCSPSAICSPWKPSGSYCRRCHQGHGYIRIKNTCAFVCVAEEQTFCKHLKPSSMGQIRQRDNLLYNPGSPGASPMHYAGSPRAAARPREPERWSEEQRRGVPLPQPRESCLQHWYLKEILLK